MRGNWRREDETGPMLLAKCCHDLDWLSYVVGRPCTAVSSFGSLTEFRPERRPQGAGERCVACAIEPECKYSARKLYLGMAERGETEWPVNVVAWPPTVENVTRGAEQGPYGRCVWAATTTSSTTRSSRCATRAASPLADHDRLHEDARARDDGSSAPRGDVRRRPIVTVHDFPTGETTRHEVTEAINSKHGGGDDGVMADFVTAAAGG